MQHITISKWGNSLGFRIPREITDSMDIKAGDTLELIPSEKGFLLKKADSRGRRYALVDILDSFAPSVDYPEVDFGLPFSVSCSVQAGFLEDISARLSAVLEVE
jgi:antitoxin MazE